MRPAGSLPSRSTATAGLAAAALLAGRPVSGAIGPESLTGLVDGLELGLAGVDDPPAGPTGLGVLEHALSVSPAAVKAAAAQSHRGDGP
ncbi:MAG TPA: hypothetical protein VGH27_34725 [Streptosporangiaceae bacterium]